MTTDATFSDGQSQSMDDSYYNYLYPLTGAENVDTSHGYYL